MIAAVFISFFTVLLSAWLPARKAARITAIDSIRGANEVKIKAKEIYTSPLVENIFGFEGTLAAKNMKRNKHNFRASVVSLTIGIILFINLSSLSLQMDLIEDMIYPDIYATVMVDYTSLLNRFINENTGRKEATIVTPIDSKFADKVTERLGEYEDTSIFGVGEDMETYDAIVPSEMISSQMLEAMKDQYPEEQASYLLSSEILTVDPQNYTLLCEKAKVPVGSNILMNHYSYNDNGELVTISPFLYEGGQLRLTPADDSIYKIPIHGILEQGDVPNELLGPNANTVRLIVPQGEMRGYTWYANPGDVEGFMDYANELMGEMFPRGQESAYMELGFTTRVYKIQDYMKIMNIFVVFAEVFVYSFVALLTLIGLTNVISTMSTNVRMRSKEFAVLQSVGMTYNGLNRMLNLESIMCSAKSLMIGLPLGILFTYLINLSIRSTFPVPYQLPWFAVIWCIAVVFGITWVTMRYSAVQLQRRNIIETIRLEA